MKALRRIALILFASLGAMAPHAGALPSTADFELNASRTRWLETTAAPETPEALVIYRSPEVYEGVQATLSVRRDANSPRGTTFQQYMRKWGGEFNRFGYKVTNSKVSTLEGADEWVVDLRAKDPKKQVRQIIFYREPEAVILTCTDHRDRFTVSLTACMSIAQSFRWKNRAQERTE